MQSVGPDGDLFDRDARLRSDRRDHARGRCQQAERIGREYGDGDDVQPRPRDHQQQLVGDDPLLGSPTRMGGADRHRTAHTTPGRGRVCTRPDGSGGVADRPAWYDAAIDSSPRRALLSPPAAQGATRSKLLTPPAATVVNPCRDGTDKGKPGVSRGRKATGLGAPIQSAGLPTVRLVQGESA